jgi:hypothetical protein
MSRFSIGGLSLSRFSGLSIKRPDAVLCVSTNQADINILIKANLFYGVCLFAFCWELCNICNQ